MNTPNTSESIPRRALKVPGKALKFLGLKTDPALKGDLSQIPDAKLMAKYRASRMKTASSGTGVAINTTLGIFAFPFLAGAGINGVQTIVATKNRRRLKRELGRRTNNPNFSRAWAQFNHPVHDIALGASMKVVLSVIFLGLDWVDLIHPLPDLAAEAFQSHFQVPADAVASEAAYHTATETTSQAMIGVAAPLAVHTGTIGAVNVTIPLAGHVENATVQAIHDNIMISHPDLSLLDELRSDTTGFPSAVLADAFAGFNLEVHGVGLAPSALENIMDVQSWLMAGIPIQTILSEAWAVDAAAELFNIPQLITEEGLGRIHTWFQQRQAQARINAANRGRQYPVLSQVSARL
jgi:hypothetical protein